MTFVFTGQLESTDRDTAVALVKRYGGKVTTQPSSRTTYVVLGEDAGPRKLEMIKKHNCATLDEDGFLNLFRTLPPKDEKGKVLPKKKTASAPEAPKPKTVVIEEEEEEEDHNAMEVDVKEAIPLLNTSFDQVFKDVMADYKNGVRSGQRDNKRASQTRFLYLSRQTHTRADGEADLAMIAYGR